MTLPFPLSPAPDATARERGRLLFAGPVTFLKGVVAMSGLPPTMGLFVPQPRAYPRTPRI